MEEEGCYKLVLIKDKVECCGCEACAQACPQNCIKMTEDLEGFCYPIVDESRCVWCGLCETVCPIQIGDRLIEVEANVEAYAAYAKELDVREKSSSGGIFTLIARTVIKEGGIVIGAAFDSKFAVHHIGVENLEELQLLRGSKYLQSRIDKAYAQAKRSLDDGRYVLFSGTACQISGLKGYLRRNYKNLLTVDVLCHGVPSPKLWQMYIREQEKCYGGELQQPIFRHKIYGWKTYAISLLFSNNTVYMKKYEEDIYMKMFLSNICLRPSCHDCRFKSLKHPSDITLGDCWGIENVMPEMDDDKGTSVVLIHTQRGENMWNLIKKNCVFKSADVETLLPAAVDSRNSVIPHWNRNRFFKKLQRGRYSQLGKLLDLTFMQRIERKIYQVMHIKKRLWGRLQ